MEPNDDPLHAPPYDPYRNAFRRSRGYLPHEERANASVLVTFRFARDFVPVVALSPQAASAFDVVAAGLRGLEAERLLVRTWVLMPDHVHLVVRTTRTPIGQVLAAYKTGTALRINRLLGRRGPVWFREYHDRSLRDERATLSAIAYVELNPVRAALAPTVLDWRWSGIHDRLRRDPPPARWPSAPPGGG